MKTSFNYEKMKEHIKNLDSSFSYFALTLKKANDIVNDFVNVSSSSSLYGEKAKKVLDLWNQNASTFGDYYQNFENWTALMVNASNAYRKFEESVFSSHRTTGNLADGVATSREQVRSLASFSRVGENEAETLINGGFTLPDGSTIQYMLDENGNTYALLNKNGARIKRVFHEDGTFTDYDLNTITDEKVIEEQPPEVLEESVTIRSGQKVNYNGEECYFLMRDGNGTDFYVKSNEKDAQVYKTDENGNLVPYTSYGSNKIVSREEFVKDRKNNMDYEWNITYNNGTSPYTNVSSEIDKTFTEGVRNAEYTNVVYDQKYLTENAVTLDNFDRGEMGIGEKEFPSVLYLAPGQSVKYDVPWDTYDNEIKGGESGTYLVYNPEQHAYYKVDENGNYHTRSEEVRGLYITEEQLLSERTTLKK